MILEFNSENSVDIHYTYLFDDIQDERNSHYSTDEIIDILPSLKDVECTLHNEKGNAYAVYTKDKIYNVFLYTNGHTCEEWGLVITPRNFYGDKI